MSTGKPQEPARREHLMQQMLALGALLLAGLAVAVAPAAAQTLSAGTHGALTEVHALMEREEYGQARTRLETLARQVRGRPYEAAVVAQTLGYALSATEDYAGAAAAFQKALDSERLPDEVSLQLRYNLAQLYMHTGKPARAVRELERWFKAAPKPTPQAHVLAATAYREVGRHKPAIRHARRALALGKPPPEPWFRLLLALYLDQQRYRDAVKLLGDMVNRFPERREYWLQLAHSHLALDDAPRAVATLELARTRGLLDGRLLTQLARLYLSTGTPYRAAALLEETLESGAIEPSRTHWLLLADSWQLAREPEATAAALRKAAALPGDGTVHLRLGRLLVEQRRWPEAARALETALERGGLKRPGLALLLLGISAAQMGDGERARSALERAATHGELAGDARRWLEYLDAEPAEQRDEG